MADPEEFIASISLEDIKEIAASGGKIEFYAYDDAKWKNTNNPYWYQSICYRVKDSPWLMWGGFGTLPASERDRCLALIRENSAAKDYPAEPPSTSQLPLDF